MLRKHLSPIWDLASGQVINDIDAPSSANHPVSRNPDFNSEVDDANEASMADLRPVRILVVAAGFEPAVVDETLDSFASLSTFAIDQLHVVVRPSAVSRFRSALHRIGSPRSTKDTGAEPVLGGWLVHGVGDSESDVGAQANDVLELLRTLCEDPRHEITLVVAADADSLGFLSVTALQLTGRPHDRIYIFERSTGRRRRRASGPKGSKRAKPLIEIPIILSEQPLLSGLTFVELGNARRMARQRLIEPGTLTLDVRRQIARIDDIEIRLEPLPFFWYTLLATLAPAGLPLRMLEANPGLDTQGRIVASGSLAERAELEQIASQAKRVFTALFPRKSEDFAAILKRACSVPSGLPAVFSKIKKRFTKVLGIGAAPYLIVGGRGAESYRLHLPPSKIRIEPKGTLTSLRSAHK